MGGGGGGGGSSSSSSSRQNVVCTDVTDEDPCNTERIAAISVYFT